MTSQNPRSGEDQFSTILTKGGEGKGRTKRKFHHSLSALSRISFSLPRSCKKAFDVDLTLGMIPRDRIVKYLHGGRMIRYIGSVRVDEVRRQ